MSVGISNSILVNSGGLSEEEIQDLIDASGGGSGAKYADELDGDTASENTVVILTEDVESQRSYISKITEVEGNSFTDRVTSTITRTAETSTTVGDFEEDEFGVYAGVLTINATGAAAAFFTNLTDNDKITITPVEGTGASHELRLVGSPTTTNRNSQPVVTVSSYLTASRLDLTDEVEYSISTINSDLNDNSFTTLNTDLHIATTSDNEDLFTNLTEDDEIHIIPESGETIVLDLSDTPGLGDLSGTDTIMLLGTDFAASPPLTIATGTLYTIYAVKVRDEVHGSAFRWDGTLWERVYENVIDSDNIEDFSVAHSDMVSGTAGNVIGYDISGNASEVGATHVITLISSASGTNKLSYNALKDIPTIPMDTTLWKGTYASGTAYAAGDIVLHSGDLYLFTAAVTTANTATSPATVTGAEQIDVGGGGDITDLTYDHPVFTLTKRDKSQTTLQIGVLTAGDSTLPTSHVKGDLYLLEGAKGSGITTYSTKLSRTATTETDVTDFATGLIQLGGSGNLFIALDGTDIDDWSDLGRGDSIAFVPDDTDNATVIFTIDRNSPSESTRNSLACIRLLASDSTQTGSFVDDATYTVYALTAGSAQHGEVFESDGNYWKCVYYNVLGTGNYEDNSVTLTKMASGTAGRVLGYDADGDPAALDGAPIATLINALTGTARVSYNNLRNKPTIPIDSTIWSGEYAARTAYDAGDIVYDGNNIWLFRQAVTTANTETDPSQVTGAEQIDVGGPNDVTGIEWDATSKTLTVEIRSGAETEHKLDNTITFGSAFPAASAEDDVFYATESGNFQTYTAKLSRTAETSPSVGDFADGEVLLTSSVMYFSATTSEQALFTPLGNGDSIAMVPSDDENDTVILSLSRSPFTSIVNGIRVVQLTTGAFSATGTFDGDETYTIYALDTQAFPPGSVFEHDGNYWGNIYDGEITADRIQNNSITTAKIADLNVTAGKLANLTVTGAKIANGTISLNKIVSGTANKYLQYNATGTLVEADAVPAADSITSAMLKNRIVSLAKMASGTANRIIGYNASGNPTITNRRGVTFINTSTFPTNPHENDVVIFKGDVRSGLSWKDTNGSTDLTSAVAGDAALWTGSNWVKQLNLSGDDDSTNWVIGSSYPASHNAGDLFLVDETSNLDVYLFKGTRTAEASNTAGDFAAGDFGIFTPGSDFIMSASAAEQTILTGLQSGDRLVAVPTTGDTVTFTLSGSPVTHTRNSIRSIRIDADDFVQSTNLFDERSYTVYAIRTRSEAHGNILESDGTYYERIYDVPTGAASGGSGIDYHFGSAFPASHDSGDLFKLDTSGNLETFILKVTRVGETNPVGTQFDANEVGVFTGVFTMSVSASERTTFTTMGSGDRLVLVPASGSNIIVTMTGSFSVGTLNGHGVIRLSASDFSISGSIADETSYTVYGLRTRSERAGNIFESDGNFWERVYELEIETEHLENDSVSLAKMAHATSASDILGYNDSGEPTITSRRNVSFGHTQLPATGNPGDLFIFTQDATGLRGYVDSSGSATTTASEGEIAAYQGAGTGWAQQINFATDRGDGDIWTFGSTYPASPSDESLFKLSQNGNLERYLTVVPRNAETSTTAGDFGSAEMGIYNGSFIMQASTTEQATFTSLGSGDKIVAIPASGDTVTVTLTGSPVSATRNSLTSIRVAAADFSIENAFTNGTRYQVYAVDSSSAEVKGSVFEYDGNYWARIYENTLTASHIPDSTLPLRKLSNGTRGHVVGYDSSGNPIEVEKTNLSVSGSLSQSPSDPFGKLLLTADITAVNVISYKSSGTSETAALETQFDLNEVGIYGNDFYWAVGTETLQDTLIDQGLVVGDIILFTAAGQSDVSITISALDSGSTPLKKATRNLHRSVTIDEDHFTQTGTFVDGTTYTIYFLKNNGTEIAGSVYQFTGGYWERIYYPDPPKHYIQATFPDEIRDGDTLHLIATTTQEILEYGPITKTAETSSTTGDFAAGEVGVFSNDLVMAVTEQEQDEIIDLELKTYSNLAGSIDLVRDDIILFKSDEGDVKITIVANDWGSGSAGSDPYDDDSPVKTGTRNSVATITIDSTKFNQIGNFVDERAYEVYFIKKNRSQRPDTYYRAKEIDTDEIYWERIYDPSEASGSDSASGGTSTISPNLRQLTQWTRATTTPDAPGNTTIDYEGFYTNFPDTANSWSASIPSGANALYVATATITRNTAGEWGYNSAWSVTPESSSQIQFWNTTTQAWESTANANNSQMRIWTSGGWKTIPLEGEFKLLEKYLSPASVSAVSNVRLSDIDKMRFEIYHFHSKFQVSVSRTMLFGEDNNELTTGAPTSANQAAVNNHTVYLVWDYRGFFNIWKKTPNDNVQITDTSVEGQISINFFKNSENELTHISTFEPRGRADNGLGYGALLRVFLEV